eukprot:jgi/Hompol1/2806/HPOL_003030-RA
MASQSLQKSSSTQDPDQSPTTQPQKSPSDTQGNVTEDNSASPPNDNEDLNRMPTDDEESKLARDMVQTAKQEGKRARDLTIDSFEKLYLLKLEEMALEEKLILSGTHPDYIQALQDIEARKEKKLKEAADRLGYAIRISEAHLDATTKLVRDTFQARYLQNCVDAKRDLRWSMFDQCMHNRFQLEAEYDQSQLRTPPVPSFSTSPTALFKRKRSMMEDYASGNLRNDIEQSVPEWARLLVHKRRRAGYTRMYIPPSCVGLDENEMDEDVSFLRMIMEDPRAQS